MGGLRERNFVMLPRFSGKMFGVVRPPSNSGNKCDAKRNKNKIK